MRGLWVSGRSHVAAFDANDAKVALLGFWAEGVLHGPSEERAPKAYTRHRLILNPSFEPNDVQFLERYGVPEIGEEPGSAQGSGDWSNSIPGGKRAEANCALVGLLWLSKEHHLALIRLVRTHGNLTCQTPSMHALGDVVTIPNLLRSDDASPLHRLRTCLSKGYIRSLVFTLNNSYFE